MQIFCTRLRELRQERSISTITLGAAIGVSNSTITRWEQGNMLPSIQHLCNLAKYFDVSADYLLGISNSY